MPPSPTRGKSDVVRSPKKTWLGNGSNNGEWSTEKKAVSGVPATDEQCNSSEEGVQGRGSAGREGGATESGGSYDEVEWQ